MIVVVDCQLGNTGSILAMFRKLGIPAKRSSEREDLRTASKIILPGVGAFDTGMNNLRGLEAFDALEKRVLEDGVPTLGICLGMQLLTRTSEEGKEKGLGWIDGDTVRFRAPAEQNLKVPHMGWNFVEADSTNPLFANMTDPWRFYFVHSYHVKVEKVFSAATTQYAYPFTSAVRRENIFGVQFHPEKSHRYGLQLLRNFASL